MAYKNDIQFGTPAIKQRFWGIPHAKVRKMRKAQSMQNHVWKNYLKAIKANTQMHFCFYPPFHLYTNTWSKAGTRYFILMPSCPIPNFIFGTCHKYLSLLHLHQHPFFKYKFKTFIEGQSIFYYTDIKKWMVRAWKVQQTSRFLVATGEQAVWANLKC